MPRKISEDQTRKQMIDPQLEQAGWYLRDYSKVKIEIPVGSFTCKPNLRWFRAPVSGGEAGGWIV
jgi:hypothetical protein